MFVKTLRLKNGYKRFHDLKIDLGDTPARIVALVGPNGCGKSSVLDGLLYHTNAFGNLIGSSPNREQNYHSMSGSNKISHQDIEITFTTGDFNTIRVLKEKLGKTNTIFSFRSPYRYNSKLQIKETRAVPEIKMNSYGAADASSLDG